jgi:hypothetical protein
MLYCIVKVACRLLPLALCGLHEAKIACKVPGLTEGPGLLEGHLRFGKLPFLN